MTFVAYPFLLLVAFFLARSSVMRGYQFVLTVGYLFGIIRANNPDFSTYFIFDAVVLGMYAGSARVLFLSRQTPIDRLIHFLILWPCIMAAIPLQHYMIQIVGLRGNMFFFPFIILGMYMKRKDMEVLARTFAVLNIVALGFGVAQFYLGIEMFFPVNQVTEIIYNSQDAGGGNFRIPACFSNAHSYGGTVIATLPILIGTLSNQKKVDFSTWLLILGIIAALAGGLLSATRTWLPSFVIMLAAFLINKKINKWSLIAIVFVTSIMAYTTLQEERFQRILTLQDTNTVTTRIVGSVNMTFLELISEYPMGNGMGAGGTSIPFFLQHYLDKRIGLENEFSRILLEQGLPGLALWIVFITVFISNRIRSNDPDNVMKQMLKFTLAFGFLTSVLGTGVMTSIPGSSMTFLYTGYCFSDLRKIDRVAAMNNQRTSNEIKRAQ